MHTFRSFLVVAIGALFTVLGLPGAAAPAGAATNANGQVAFDEQLCCSFDIWVVNADGSGLTNLTNTPDAAENAPAWSPDGTKIAFVRDSDIWVMNADGSNQVDLTNQPEVEFNPDWSADGSQIAYVRLTVGEFITSQFDIFTMNADGSNQVNITNSDTDELDPAFSPAGGAIAYAAVRNGDWEIVTAAPDGTGELTVSTLGQEDRYPTWAPDGSKIAWQSQHNDEGWMIWAMNADGTGATQFTDTGRDQFPEWAPDGTKIVFTRFAGASWDLWTIDAPTVLPPAASPLRAAVIPTAAQLTVTGTAGRSSWGSASGTVIPGAIVRVSVSDLGFQPARAKAHAGDTVVWKFVGSSVHSVTDHTGLLLFDSGPVAAGGRFTFTFGSAGTYFYGCSIHPLERAKVSVPIVAAPLSGGITSSFTITWASAVPTGYVADIQVKRPGTAIFRPFLKGTTTTKTRFTPNAGAGSYSFRARLRLPAVGSSSGWSPVATIAVA
jgi:plastocyanin